MSFPARNAWVQELRKVGRGSSCWPGTRASHLAQQMNALQLQAQASPGDLWRRHADSERA
jgi:hypothetical protein